jgi:hypothetical protein
MDNQKKPAKDKVPSNYVKPIVFMIGKVSELTLGGRGQTTDSGVGYTRANSPFPW